MVQRQSIYGPSLSENDPTSALRAEVIMLTDFIFLVEVRLCEASAPINCWSRRSGALSDFRASLRGGVGDFGVYAFCCAVWLGRMLAF